MRKILPTTPLIFILSTTLCWSQPKYVATTTPISRDHSYFQRSAAPDYWALSPYYAHQQTGSACSIASVTMIVNAALSSRDLDSETPLATQDSVLTRTGDLNWNVAVGGIQSESFGERISRSTRYLFKNGPSFIQGVTLDQLGNLTEKALRAHGFAEVKVEVVHAEDQSEIMKQKLRQTLIENEKTSSDFLLINFTQGTYTGDEGAGHISPVGAYDSEKKRVLVMDVDRKWYEPYWVSEETLLQGMATQDKTSMKNRGWVRIRLNSQSSGR